ncbi:MAG: hemolysin family protein [Clostridium sp.]
MDVSPSGSFILIFVLVLINAFFSSAEMAIISINKTKINLLAEEGNKKALLISKLIDEPSNFLATIQVGITLAGFFASASAATSISGSFGTILNNFNIPYSNEIALFLVTIFISYITLVLGELLPKRIALQKAEAIAMFSVKPITFISKLAKPFVIFLSGSTNILLKLLGMSSHNISERVSREELKSIIELGEVQGAINEIEREMIDGVIEFDDKLAKEIMTPRTEVFMLEGNSSIKDNIDVILKENFSRIPIYENDIDNIIGVLYMKDLFSSVVTNGIENINIKSLIRKPYFVPETNSIDKLFKALKESQNYLSILIDEYGGFSGIVTMEDLIEEVVGDISDEFDDNCPEIEKIDQFSYIVNGLVTIDEVNDTLGLTLKSDSTDTIGGFIMELLGTVPKEDDNIEINHDNIFFKVLTLDEKRIEKIKIHIN